MAEQMKKELEEKQVKKAKPFQKFLFLGVVPLSVALIAALIVATVAGVNVMDEAKSISKRIPFTSSLFQQDSANSKQETSSNLRKLKQTLQTGTSKYHSFSHSLARKTMILRRLN